MGIGFVIVFWGIVFTVLAAIYLFLHLLAKENKGAADFKKAFQVIFGGGFILAICLLVFAIVKACLDYFYPSQIFTDKFGFEPPADVRIIEGSSYWTPFGNSAHLQFRASERTIERILDTGFGERTKNDARFDDSPEIKEILAQPQSHYYIKDDFSSTQIRLAYDEQSQNAYFYLVDFDN